MKSFNIEQCLMVPVQAACLHTKATAATKWFVYLPPQKKTL